MPEWLNFDPIAKVFSSARKTSKGKPITDVTLKNDDGDPYLSGLPVSLTGSPALQGKVKNVTTAGTRVQLDNLPCREVTVIARKGNAGSIFVGGSDVSAAVFGVELLANESFTFPINNANLIYIDASVSGEGVSYVTV